MSLSSCAVLDCPGAHCAKGYCAKHYARLKRHGDPLAPDRRLRQTTACGRPGCLGDAYCLGLCAKHYARHLRGTLDRPDACTYSYVEATGYVSVRAPGGAGWTRQHRLVAEADLGRPLLACESVHHLNGVRDDNRSENLEIWVSSQPSGQRIEDLVTWATELLSRYAPDRLA